MKMTRLQNPRNSSYQAISSAYKKREFFSPKQSCPSGKIIRSDPHLIQIEGTQFGSIKLGPHLANEENFSMDGRFKHQGELKWV